MFVRYFKNRWRIDLIIFLIGISVMLLIARLAYVQFIDQEHGQLFLQSKGEKNTVHTQLIAAGRGKIFDRHGKLLAYSTPLYSVWLNVLHFENKSGDIEFLAEELNLQKEKLIKKINSGGYINLAHYIDSEQVRKIKSKKITGLNYELEYKRYYPAAEIASHIVGITDRDDKGQEGIELAFNHILEGKFGKQQVMRNRLGAPIKDIQMLKAAKLGDDLTLSIDMRLQYLAYKELKAAVEKYKATSGSIVLLDAKTAEILAMVNQPSYNSNNRKGLKYENMRNRAIIDVFEPGSTVKPFTIAAALESGNYTPNSVIDTSPGFIRLGGKIIPDSKDHKELSLAEVLVTSSQVGTTKVALNMDINEIRDMFVKVGFGEYCATGFPGESIGFLPNYQKWSEIQRAALSFGHGMEVNALQLARAYVSIASGGLRKEISLIKSKDRIEDAVDGQRIFSKEVARDIKLMMKDVVEHGTGVLAQIPGFSVAGKTGTSHRVGKQGYLKDSYRATFAGMVPAYNPKIVAVVTIEDPKGDKYYGGEIAAPVFSKVVQSALRIMDVKPDKPNELLLGKNVKEKNYIKPSLTLDKGAA